MAAGWVKHCRLGNANRKAVMLVIADYSTEDGSAVGVPVPEGWAVCLADLDTIAEGAEVPVRNVEAILRSMSRAGVIERRRGQPHCPPRAIWIHWAREPVELGRHCDGGWRVQVPRRIRDLVYARDGRLCQDCGATSDLTLDHIVPWIHGGSNEPGNLRVLCRSCNSRKGARI